MRMVQCFSQQHWKKNIYHLHTCCILCAWILRPWKSTFFNQLLTIRGRILHGHSVRTILVILLEIFVSVLSLDWIGWGYVGKKLRLSISTDQSVFNIRVAKWEMLFRALWVPEVKVPSIFCIDNVRWLTVHQGLDGHEMLPVMWNINFWYQTSNNRVSNPVKFANGGWRLKIICRTFSLVIASKAHGYCSI